MDQTFQPFNNNQPDKTNMKLIKTLICVAAAGAVTAATCNVYGAMGEVNIKAKANYQDYNSKGYEVMKKEGVGNKEILFLLAMATGDDSITNSKTKLLYDPDAYNYAWYYSDNWDGYDRYGLFFYTNDVAGLVPLQDYDEGYDYYSWIELDSFVGYDWYLGRLGMAYQNYLDFNAVAKASDNKLNLLGNAVLYIHSNEYDWDILRYHYFANGYYGYYQSYALVIQGLITFKASESSSSFKESFSLQGSGDGVWYDSEMGYIPLVIDGKVKFSGKQTGVMVE